MSDIQTLNAMQPNQLEAVTIRPYYECNSKGVFYVGIEADKESKQPTHKEPMYLADEIRLIGRGIDDDGQYYRVYQWLDRFTHRYKTDALEMGLIGTNDCWKILQSKGLIVLTNRRKRDLLADYLQTQGSNDKWKVTTKAGWCGSSYILPNGEVIQPENTGHQKHTGKQPNLIFKGDKSQAMYYQESGTLNEWQTHIADYALNNSRLCLAIGCAFAAPLMRLVDIEGGGFHLFGDSSDGKTTSAKVALSVWGKADDLKMGWRGTDLGFSNIANARNDGLLVLDEVGEANARVVSTTAYSILNGKGKIQGAKEGGNRVVNEWRVLVLSTGEQTLEAYLQSGNTDLHAGQAVRLPSIPANAGKGYGIFDTLHSFENGAELSEHLSTASNHYYGTAGRAFIAALLSDDHAKTTAQKAINEFLSLCPELSHQAKRVGTRFALVSASLILASQYGIIHMSESQINMCIKQCFDAWLVREGTGKREDKKILEQAKGFMQIHANNRFMYLPLDPSPTTIPNLAGYRENAYINEDIVIYYVIPEVFNNEIAKGFDSAKVCEVLHSANEWLQKHNGRWQKQKRINKELQRFYVLVGTVPSDEIDDEGGK